jgi:hypothetical protein
MKTHHFAALLAATVAAAASGCSKAEDAGTEDLTIVTNSLPAPESSQPKAEVKIQGVSREEELSLLDLLQVTGLLTRGTQQVAIINGNVVTMGEDMYMDTNLHRYKMQVLSIKGNVVKLKAEIADDAPTSP